MRDRLGSIALANLSLAGILGGIAWLVILGRSTGADRSSMDLGAGRSVTIEYEANDPHVFSRDERAAIGDVAARAVADVQHVLPGTLQSIVLRVGSAPSRAVMHETGEIGENAQPNVVVWRVDAGRPNGVVGVVRAQLRACLFHEIDHLVRGASVFDRDIRGHVVREGLATAFERDFSGSPPPAWSQYDAGEVDAWTREVLALPDDAPRDVWLFQHPDGRRWIGLRVGTYLVDRATHATGKTSAELVAVPTATILDMALGSGALHISVDAARKRIEAEGGR